MSTSVLVIDDDAEFRKLAREILEALGLSVVGEAETIAAAAAIANEVRPQAALVDVGLPDGSGVDLAAQLVGLPWRPRVVLTSTDPGAVTESMARSAGAAAFIAKSKLPGDLGSLLTDERNEADVTAPIRVVIGEDDVLLREGIAQILERAGFEVAAQSGNADDFLRRAQGHRPEVAVVDIQMPPGNADDGLRAALELRAQRPDTGVVVLSQFFEESYAIDLIGDRPEGVGYLLKERVGDVSVFIDAVRRVAAGGTALDPEIVARMMGRRRLPGPFDELSPRDRDVLREMAEGKSNSAIAETLFISEAAVEKHVTAIFRKLGLESTGGEHRRVLAVVRYLRETGS